MQLRHTSNDLTIYEPIRYQPVDDTSLTATLQFKKAANSAIAKSPVVEDADPDDDVPETRFVPLRQCTNVNGYSTVFLPGPSPSFILKSSKSIPRVISLQGLPVRGMSTFHTEGCDRGFIYADSEGIARVTQLPLDTDLTQLGMSVRKVPLNMDVRHIAYHQPTETYVAGCVSYEPFELPRDDDYHKEWARETLTFPPNVARGILKLINPTTWTAIDTYELESCESVESMKVINLEVSEETKERRMVLAVGSALSKGEDLPTRGRVQVLEIVTVIPEPGHPETNRRLKPIAKEDIPRGGVTALSEIGTQGLMLVAQGQKCMVRGLKEDGSLLPVAFLDMNCHVASVRALPRTGLCLVSDAFKGVWFAGYTEEPYTFKVLGKTGSRVPALVADFLPDGEDLGIVVVDTEGEMHILEFNPERESRYLVVLSFSMLIFSNRSQISPRKLAPPPHNLLRHAKRPNINSPPPSLTISFFLPGRFHRHPRPPPRQPLGPHLLPHPAPRTHPPPPALPPNPTPLPPPVHGGSQPESLPHVGRVLAPLGRCGSERGRRHGIGQERASRRWGGAAAVGGAGEYEEGGDGREGRV